MPAVIWLSAAPVALYLDPNNSHFLWRSIVYVPAAALTLATLWRRRARLSQVLAAPGRNPLVNVIDPRRYFEEIKTERSSVAEAPPVCLYLEVTNRCNLLCETCPADLRDAGTAGRHELGAVHQDRRSGAERRPRGPAWRRRADAGQATPADDPLPQGSRHLRPVQHQRHAVAAQAFSGADRHRARRVARLARRRRSRDLPQGARQGTISTASSATWASSSPIRS